MTTTVDSCCSRTVRADAWHRAGYLHELLAADRLRVLAVRQPWADLITQSLLHWWRQGCPALTDTAPKDVENRCWTTDWRGTLLIHASKTIRRAERQVMRSFGLDPKQFTYGAVVGVAELTGVIQDADSVWADPGQWHWLLRGQNRLIQPVPYIGGLGLRKPSPTLVRQVTEQAWWL